MMANIQENNPVYLVLSIGLGGESKQMGVQELYLYVCREI